MKHTKKLTTFINIGNYNYIDFINDTDLFSQLSSKINAFQCDIERIYDIPNVIHAYDRQDVNKNVIGSSPEDYVYQKFKVYTHPSIGKLSLFLFIPTFTTAITPPS
ncbi:hypothetical protein DID76_00900 [Candidatus Marinamargulisbacteria bacterium SCGC AG-414-C22]|nr:hypothetical protein DID76_00900 [Candidatus Marinamargulisbacteria bacterium SCGC AG-414-C22]